MRKYCLLTFATLLVCTTAFGQTKSDSVRIHFRQGSSLIDFSIRNNRQSLARISNKLVTSETDSIYRISAIDIYGGASPEGSVALNQQLSARRANALFDILADNGGTLPDSPKRFHYLGRDWKGLLTLVEADPNVPHRADAIKILRDIIATSADTDSSINRLLALHNGRPWQYMYSRLFPELRASRLVVSYRKVANPTVFPTIAIGRMLSFATPTIPSASEVMTTPAVEVQPTLPPRYMTLKTNLLYDAALVPNIGAELYVGKQFSIAANWMYAWWHSDRRHNYWRIYGGDIELRRWIGSTTPLRGHHIGIYAQMLTYDFELGGRGYLGDRWSYASGIAYGYSMPIARRLNLDFTIGIGYLRGRYKEYLPQDGHYVWQSTRMRQGIYPTKAEISLSWLIGRGNYNIEKGGRR